MFCYGKFKAPRMLSTSYASISGCLLKMLRENGGPSSTVLFAQNIDFYIK